MASVFGDPESRGGPENSTTRKKPRRNGGVKVVAIQGGNGGRPCTLRIRFSDPADHPRANGGHLIKRQLAGTSAASPRSVVMRGRLAMSRAVLKFVRQASLFEQATRPWLAVQDLG